MGWLNQSNMSLLLLLLGNQLNGALSAINVFIMRPHTRLAVGVEQVLSCPFPKELSSLAGLRKAGERLSPLTTKWVECRGRSRRCKCCWHRSLTLCHFATPPCRPSLTAVGMTKIVLLWRHNYYTDTGSYMTVYQRDTSSHSRTHTRTYTRTHTEARMYI